MNSVRKKLWNEALEKCACEVFFGCMKHGYTDKVIAPSQVESQLEPIVFAINEELKNRQIRPWLMGNR